ncbi:MAG: helicase-related protein [Candidatus Nezhaarchaeales archaeon]
MEKSYVQHPLLKPRAVEDRLYQRKILETARSRNTLIVLPTALGKTIIAMLLALEKLNDGKVLFMAPTRPLAYQHYETFKDKTSLSLEELALVTGKHPQSKRIQLYESARVIFATPQCIYNDLKSAVLSLDGFSLLIFDEAHRARGNYAYVGIASTYVQQRNNPLIIGLTASPGGSEESIAQICRNLAIEAIEFRHDEDPDVKPYIQPVEVQWRPVVVPEPYLKVRNKLKEMLIERIKRLQALGVLTGKEPAFITRRDLVELNEELQRRLVEGSGGYLYEVKVQATAALSVAHMIELIETQGPETLKAFMDKTLINMAEEGSRGHKSILNDPLFTEAKIYTTQALATPNPKVEELKRILQEQFNAKPDSRLIVFSQYRDTVDMILKRLEGLPRVKAARFVGQGFKDGSPGMTQEQQHEAIQKLRGGEVNVLVATSIAEEGLDIPEVDHVVFYEPVPSEIRYIQRRGRTGRRVAGKVSIIMAEGTLDEVFYWTTIAKVRRMRRVIKQLNRKLPKRQVVIEAPKPQVVKPVILKPEERITAYIPPPQTQPVKRVKQYEWFTPELVDVKGLGKAFRWFMGNLPSKPVPVQKLVEQAVEATGLSKAQVETALWRLLQQGMLYQPEPGMVVTVNHRAIQSPKEGRSP